MNQKQYIKLCKEEYLSELAGIFILCILTYLWLPGWISFPIIMYNFSALAFNIGALKSCLTKKEEIKLSKME